ncbi:hypothetical protein JCM3766R1_005360 [Sporobolomyces carnicolor]
MMLSFWNGDAKGHRPIQLAQDAFRCRPLFNARRPGKPGEPWTLPPAKSYWHNLKVGKELPVVRDKGEAFSLTFVDLAGDFFRTFGSTLRLSGWNNTEVPGQPRYQPPGLDLLTTTTIHSSFLDPADVTDQLRKCVKDVRQTIAIADLRRKAYKRAKAKLSGAFFTPAAEANKDGDKREEGDAEDEHERRDWGWRGRRRSKVGRRILAAA